MLRVDESPAQQCAQYLAHLLLEEPSRLQLLWRTAGCENLTQWCAQHECSMQILRRAVLVGAASLHLRLVSVLRQFPWRLCELADGRTPLEVREKIAREFDAARACCLPPGVARELKASGVTGQELLTSEAWHQVLWEWSKLVTLQIADVEWRHRRCRSRLNRLGQSRYSHFVAKDVNQEAVLTLQSTQAQLEQLQLHPQRQQQQHRGDPGGRPATGARAARKAEGRLRASTDFQLYHWDRVRTARHMGQRCNPASREADGQVNDCQSNQ